ncbi:MAG: hypothetical protein ACTHMM_19490 [Agriterribacter sp.]
MKRKLYFLFFTAVACTITNQLNAQIAKGTDLLGGSVSFSSNKSSTYADDYQNQSSSFYVSPAYGKFVKQNLVLGAELSYGNQHTTNTSPGNPERKEKDNYYGVGVFLRQYKNLGSSGFFLFLQSRLGGTLSRGTSEYSNGYDKTESKGYSVNLNLSPGIAYAITPRFHFETGLNNLLYAGYQNTRYKATGSTQSYDSKSNSFNAGASVGSGLQWTIGFRILLPQ